MSKVKNHPGTGQKVAKVLIVDDHSLVRHGLTQLIEEEPDLEVCGQASNAAEALRSMRQVRPDVAVVDISLTDASGIELIKEIRARDDTIRVLVSSMHEESLYAERALRAGAVGYVNKHESTEKIIEAIRTALSGRIYLSNSMTNRVLHRMIGGAKEGVALPVDRLSDRELEVLQMLGSGMSSREVAESLCLSPKTVQTHRENIKKKLNLKNSADLTHYAVQWVLDSTTSRGDMEQDGPGGSTDEGQQV